MNQPQVLTFSGYSQDRFNRLVVVLKQKGLTLSGNEGDVKRAGADVQWNEASGVLTLTVEHAPFWHSMESFCNELSTLVNGVPAVAE